MLKKVILFFILIYCSSIGFSDVNINDCTTTQILNVSGETYLVTGNLSTTTTCFDIQAENITLDCQGYTLSGDRIGTDYGIKIDGASYSDNNLMNCNFNGFRSGIELLSSGYNFIENCSFTNETYISISMSQSVGNYFNNILVNSSYGGFSLNVFSRNNVVNNSKIINSIDFAYLVSSPNYFYNTVINTSNSLYFRTTNAFYDGCSGFIFENISDDNGNSHYFFKSNQDISLLNDISTLTYCGVNDSIIEGNSFQGGGNGIFLNVIESKNLTFRNFGISNYYDGIHIFNSNNISFFNFTLDDIIHDASYFENSNFNVFSNFNFLDISGYDIKFRSGSSKYSENNIFYNNLFQVPFQISTTYDFAIYPNYFNYTLPSGLNVGNYWTDLSCTNSVINGSYEICTNPNNYTIDLSDNIYDFAPLVLPTIDVNFAEFEEGDYYSQNVYVEVNASKDISTCTLNWNGSSVSMTVSGDVCYITKSGSYGSSYNYNVSVVGVNTAIGLTETKSVNFIDSNVSYVSPTPVDGLNKYNLSDFTISFNDDLGYDDCIYIINGVSYSNVPVGSFCNYTYSILQSNLSKKIVEFEGFYNVSGVVTSVGKRTIKSYSDDSDVESLIVPGFGFGSLVAFVVLLFFGGLF